MFQLDPRLDADTVFINALPLCDLRLMLDANYPWLVLIPRVAGITELYELADKDYKAPLKITLLHEITKVSY